MSRSPTKVFPNWRGATVCIVASGPSLDAGQVQAVRHLPRVVINNTWMLAPDADMLYACDGKWWRREGPGYGQKALRDFAGIKATQDEKSAKDYGLIHTPLARVDGDALYEFQEHPPFIGSGGSSGFQALNLVAHQRPRRVILLGFDASTSHWHVHHPTGLNNPNDALVAEWIAVFERAAPILAGMGVEVINASRKTALECFPRMTIEDALNADP